ncbi:MAG: DUF1549 domain-containing protein, partial [Verrucomicrobiae bacterium]|nr:DUF1549 domain-containing protein [Verrucomicrobiae bacterium]
AYEKHWAYEKPVRAELLPSVKAQVKNEIDRFVFAKLESESLAPSPEAAPETLLRRVSLDLTGLPPSPEELDRFLAEWKSDPEAAYAGAVDRLLKSERFGERWARPWLDLARYADSNGFQADQLRDSWAYRDWVIGALNQNMPFDRFTIEQLAGDLLPDATVEQKIATGFHRTVTCNVEAGVHPEENRVNQVVDRVNTTGTVWLGSTIECAQCHDHKYDPFSMADYYSIFAYFNNTPVEVENPSGKGVSFDFYGPKMELPLDAAKQTERASLTAKLDELKGRQKTLAAANEKDRAEWESRLLASAAKAPVWETLEIEDFSGTGGETWERLEDGSLLVKGELPKQTTYTVKAWTKVNGIRAVKIEALTHESLPDQGPGRGDRPNIIVNEVRLAAATGGGKDEPVALHGAEADFSQNNWDVGGAIDGDPKTGWAINPEFGKDHWMTVRTGGPIPSNENGTLLTLALDQNYGGGRTIGRLRVSVTADEPAAPDLPEDLTAILKKPAGKRSAKDKKTLDEQFAKANPKLLALNREIAGVEKALKAVEPDTTLVMVEMDESRETHVMTRGNYLAPAEKVGARTPAALHPLDPALPKNRLGFAKWLMDRENPLVARVTVNRWWNEIFGHGLVGTLEDFGAQGDPPSHPELLDWLAVEFMDSGWDMKHVLRLMVTSAVYRQSSRVTPELLEKDPANVLYARGPRFRMSAEMIRDNGLAVAGLLSTRMGGKPIMPYQPPGLWRQIGR